MTSIDFNKKIVAVITGASQGIGQTLAIEFAKLITNDSVLILIARSEKGLNETKELISNGYVTVRTIPLDLTKPNPQILDGIFVNLSGYELGVVFHNVGQVGTLDNTTELTDIQAWRDYYDLNVFSVSILNSIFFKKLHKSVEKLFVINLTSKCGRVPFKNMAMYGSGKAARELFFRVFAEEEKDVTVLNYSPGPVETPMVQEVVMNLKNDETRDDFVKMRENKMILTTDQTVEKLLGVLEKGDYKSGDTIDYFDRI